jgi:hypothetical protein
LCSRWPGSPDFQATAVAWAARRGSPRLPTVRDTAALPDRLAALARHHIAACVQGARDGYRTTRTELDGTLPPHTVDEVLEAYRSEGQRLVATARAVELIARALRIRREHMQDR